MYFRHLSALFSVIFLLSSSAFAQLSNGFNVSNVNDWGSGFNATFSYQLSQSDAPGGALAAWRIDVRHTGAAQLTSAWMTGYNGSISSGYVDGSSVDFAITNSTAGFQPTLNVGSELIFTIQGQGSGFNESDFEMSFVNLDAGEPPTDIPDDDNNEAGSLSTSFVSVNDWYNPAFGGGFNATYRCEVNDSSVTDFVVEFNYSGSGNPSSAWTQSYNGSVNSGFIGSDGGFAIRSSSSGFVPTLNAGASFLVTIQVQDAGFNPSDFNVSCNGDTTSDSVNNTAPVANAGNNLTVSTGIEVTLDGSLSSDEEGDELVYSWTIEGAPVGSSASLINSSDVTPSFVPDLAGDYQIQLVVNDGLDDSLVDEVIISASDNNIIPVANAGNDTTTLIGSQVTLSGFESTDDDLSSELSYEWVFLEFPSASDVSFSDAFSSNPTFTPDAAGEYRIQLIVNDGTSDSLPDEVVVTAIENPDRDGDGIINELDFFPDDPSRSTVPLVSITSPETLTTVGTSPLTITGTIDDPDARVVVNGVEVTQSEGTFQADVDLEEGFNSIVVRGIDENNNEGLATLNVSLDNTPPCLLYTSPSPRDRTRSRMPSSA